MSLIRSGKDHKPPGRTTRVTQLLWVTATAMAVIVVVLVAVR